MNTSEYKKIIELFQYSREIRELFSFIDEYTKNIERWLHNHQLTNEQLLRYMIAGLFLEFEVISSHQRSNFTTVPEKWSHLDKRPKIKEQLEVFNAYYGRTILSTNEYATLLGLTDNVIFKKVEIGELDKNSDVVKNAVKRFEDKYQRLFEGGLYHYVIDGHY